MFDKLIPYHSPFIEHSYPFFTHDTLRSFLDWNLMESPSIDWIHKNGAIFQDGDSIFLHTDHIYDFATIIDPVIKKRYILITGNSDFSAPGNYDRNDHPAPGNQQASNDWK